jgi:hypothetical protein
MRANAFGTLVGLLSATVLIPLIADAILLCIGSGKPPASIFTLTALAVGTFLGAMIGASQWRVLRIVVPGVRAWAWTIATAAASLLLWALVFMPEVAAGGVPVVDPAPWQETFSLSSLAVGGCYGAVLGGVFGSVQWIALRKHVRHAFWWIVGASGAGALALPLGYIAATYAQMQTSYVRFWIAGGFSAALIAALCACVTGTALLHLRTRSQVAIGRART